MLHVTGKYNRAKKIYESRVSDKFERDYANYLTREFEKYLLKNKNNPDLLADANGISFVNYGGSNSTIPDIAVFKDDDKIPFLWIECKMGKAQAGQFVVTLAPNGKEFVVSEGSRDNTVHLDEVSKNEYDIAQAKILASMNEPKAFEDICSKIQAYKNKTGNGQLFKIDSNLTDINYGDIIANVYKNKKALWVMTKLSSASDAEDPIILPMTTDMMKRCFHITGLCRAKGSGSQSLSQQMSKNSGFTSSLLSELNSHRADGLPIDSIEYDFIKKCSSSKESWAVLEVPYIGMPFEFKYDFGGEEGVRRFKVAAEDASNIDRVRIRLLSETFNPTIIFSIECTQLSDVIPVEDLFVDIISRAKAERLKEGTPVVKQDTAEAASSATESLCSRYKKEKLSPSRNNLKCR